MGIKNQNIEKQPSFGTPTPLGCSGLAGLVPLGRLPPPCKHPTGFLRPVAAGSTPLGACGEPET